MPFKIMVAQQWSCDLHKLSIIIYSRISESCPTGPTFTRFSTVNLRALEICYLYIDLGYFHFKFMKSSFTVE